MHGHPKEVSKGMGVVGGGACDVGGPRAGAGKEKLKKKKKRSF